MKRILLALALGSALFLGGTAVAAPPPKPTTTTSPTTTTLPGPAPISIYNGVSAPVTFDGSQPRTATASCNAGDKAVSVGYTVNGATQPFTEPVYVYRHELVDEDTGLVNLYSPASGSFVALVLCIEQ